ncbi:sigma-70 family RNA polymerase sigma factor [Streptomyces sp. NPDC001581]|uniref:RNA polymerase sigma factor n=1 Tax=Streptomyces sp. NPDC001581 TaxID=3154386 RepID=UPI0033177BF6
MEDLFASLYREKGGILRRHALRCLREEAIPSSRLSAEDVVQDALLIAITNHKQEPIANPGGYVYRVIESRVRDESKRKGVADPIDFTPAGAENRGVLWVSAVEEDIEGRLDAEKILQEMSPQQRRLILLSKGMGLSHTELAQATGLHRGTIAQHITRATKILTAGLGIFVVVLAFPLLVQYCLRAGKQQIPGRVREFLSRLLPDLPEWFDPMWILYLAAVVFVLLLIPLRNLYKVWRLHLKQVRISKKHNDKIISELIKSQDLVRVAVGKSIPTVAEYAAHTGLPAGLITADALKSGYVQLEDGDDLLPLRILMPDGTTISVERLHETADNEISLTPPNHWSR